MDIENDAAVKILGANPVQILPLSHIAEKARTAAQQNWVDQQLVFIDQVAAGQFLNQAGAPIDENVAG